MTQLALTLDHPMTGHVAAHLLTPARRRRILANYGTGRSSVTFYIRKSDGGLMTWSGKGQKPMWVKQWLDNGGRLEDLAVTIKKEGGT